MSRLFTWIRYTVLLVGLGALLSGCMPPTSPDSYSAYDAGISANVQHGKIVDIRTVTLQGSKWGAPIGAAAGGIGGSFIGGDTRVNMLGALGGAVAGGIVGYYADQKITSREALQYIVQLDSGKTIAVVQGKDPILSRGQRVLVMVDRNKARIVADNTGYTPRRKSTRRAKPKPAPAPVSSSSSKTVTTTTTTTMTTTRN